MIYKSTGGISALESTAFSDGRGEREKADQIRVDFLRDFNPEALNAEGERLKSSVGKMFSEIGRQWMTPELIVAGLSAGIGGIHVINSPLRTTAKATKNVGKGAEGVVKSKPVHGNSLNSQKPTWGYKLYDKETGKFLKNGITSKEIPQKRYTKSFMDDKYMNADKFSNRRSAYEWEATQNMIQRGPLNKNMH